MQLKIFLIKSFPSRLKVNCDLQCQVFSSFGEMYFLSRFCPTNVTDHMGSSGHYQCARLCVTGFIHIGSSHFHHRAIALAMPSAWNILSLHLYTSSSCPLSLRSLTFIHSLIPNSMSASWELGVSSLGDKMYEGD